MKNGHCEASLEACKKTLEAPCEEKIRRAMHVKEEQDLATHVTAKVREKEEGGQE